MEEGYDIEYWKGQRRTGCMVFMAFAIVVSLGMGFLVASTIGPIPYMDEIFHVRQTQEYCLKGNWTHWDEKITTLPGLYVMATGFSKTVSVLLQPLFNLSQYLVYGVKMEEGMYGSSNISM